MNADLSVSFITLATEVVRSLKLWAIPSISFLFQTTILKRVLDECLLVSFKKNKINYFIELQR